MNRNTKWIKISLAGLMAIVIAGCSGADSNMGSKIDNSTSGVEDVLAQGVNEAESASSDVTVPNPDDAEEVDQSGDSSLNTSSDAADSASDILLEVPNGDLEDVEYETEADPSVDLDLTALSATMVYSEVYQMMYYPENYVGKSVKMEGLYDIYHDDNTGADYYACIIQDATACCSQGIEFKLADGFEYPEESVTEVSVKGIFDLYEEDGVTYCTLRDAELLSAS